jgi:hypothetical protein
MGERAPAENPKLMTGVSGFSHGRGAAMKLVGILLALAAASATLLVQP